MSVLWHHGVRTGRLTPSEFVAATSTNAAKIFNIYPKKGAIAVGSHADIVVWDPNSSRTISADTHHQQIDFNIYEGMEGTGVAAVTLRRGQVVYQNGELMVTKGAGKHIHRPCFPNYYDAINLRRAAHKPTAVKRD